MRYQIRIIVILGIDVSREYKPKHTQSNLLKLFPSRNANDQESIASEHSTCAM